VGDVTRGFSAVYGSQVVRKKSQVTEKQVGYRVSPQPPYRMWSQSEESLKSLAEGL
jgi:hypothetical protein